MEQRLLSLIGPNQPQTLTGIETRVAGGAGIAGAINGPINLKPLQGLKRWTAAGGSHIGGAQSTSNPYRD